MIFKKEVRNLEKMSSILAMAIGLPVYKKIIKRITRRFTEHRLAIKLLSQDENLKALTDIILKRERIVFRLIPVKNKEIIWQVRAHYIKKGSIKKNLYYEISIAFNPSKSSFVPYDKAEQLLFLAHEFLHIILEHHPKIINSCGLCSRDCLKQELEACVGINGVLKQIGVKVILSKKYWRNRIFYIMDQCQEENQGQKCLRIILDGKCPETKSIKLYLKMIALDAKEGFLSK